MFRLIRAKVGQTDDLNKGREGTKLGLVGYHESG